MAEMYVTKWNTNKYLKQKVPCIANMELIKICLQILKFSNERTLIQGSGSLAVESVEEYIKKVTPKNLHVPIAVSTVWMLFLKLCDRTYHVGNK